jgi:L-ribulokinase
MSEDVNCIGIDFGTDSVRAIIVNAENGREVASAVYNYPRWKEGLFCNASANQFRQHPLDYIEGMVSSVTAALREAGPTVKSNIRAISIATTGSTPVAVDKTGTPLALHPDFTNDPDAMFMLWKDHSSLKETAQINAHAKKFTTDYLRYVGGIYSSEWYWSKLLHILRKNPLIRKHCISFVEHCDWMPFLLTGGTAIGQMKRSVCTAGHKALWAEEWRGFPPDEFFSSLDPLLSGFASSLPSKTYTADQTAGTISEEWAANLGLNKNVVIGIGAMDAHMAAVGGQIEPYFLSKVMGTSTCDMLVAPTGDMKGKFVQGICGSVNGSIIPGMTGLEAGQSAFGDVYAWLRNVLAWPLKHLLEVSDANRVDKVIDKIIPELSRQAAVLDFNTESVLSLDWFNGRRTPDANATLKASITGISLGTDAPEIFRSLAEATCFGAKAIVDRFVEQGIPVKGLIGIGGVAKKSDFIMQMMADVLNLPIKVNQSEQSAALGAAMFAATAGSVYAKVQDAMLAMGNGFEKPFFPNPGKNKLYETRYRKYLETGRFVEEASGDILSR